MNMYDNFRKSPRGMLFRYNRRWKKVIRKKKNLTNKEFNTKTYKKAFGVAPDLEDPKTFGEKIQWLKLYYNNPLYTICADKYAVREYVRRKGHADILNELLGAYDSADEVPVDLLPDRFVIKANHGCGWNMVCRDKQKMQKKWSAWKKVLDCWLKQDYGVYSRELHYSHIPPKLVVEKFLDDVGDRQIMDYKFHCFNGQPKVVQVDYERSADHKQSYHDEEWNLLNVNYVEHPVVKEPIARPENLDRMLGICRDLAADFFYVRVDLYLSHGKIYFGEMTFADGSGFAKYEPAEFRDYMGSLIELPGKDDPYVMLKSQL